MTILFLSRLFYPHIGGVEKHVYEISKILLKKGHKVTVVTEQLPTAKAYEIWEGIEIYRIPVGKNNWFKKFRIWFWFFKHINLIKDTDIVHAHDVFFWYLPFRFLFPFKKVYTTFHGYESYPIHKSAIVVRKISEKLSLGNICIGGFMKKWYKTKPTLVSYGGVKAPQKENVQKKEQSAIFIGRLDEQTGIDMYNKAFKIIKEKFPKFTFVVYGDGVYKNKLDKRITQKGFLENAADSIQHYQFAFISRYLGILEAMAAKRLVIAAYDNLLKKDYLQKTPFNEYIVTTNSPVQIAQQVSYYLSQKKEYDQLVKRAHRWVKNLTWDTVVSVYLKLWKQGG